MALLDSYATLADLKARLRIPTLVTTDDTILTDALKSASRSIEGATSRQFNVDGAGLTSRSFYATSPDVVFIDDVSTTTGLVIKTDNDDDGTFETTWSASDYLLRPLNGIENGVSGWAYSRIEAVGGMYFPVSGRYGRTAPVSREFFGPIWPVVRRRPGVQVTATFGWPNVPENIRQACMILAEELFKLKDAPFGVAGWGQYGQIRVRENPKIAELLSQYTQGQVIFS